MTQESYSRNVSIYIGSNCIIIHLATGAQIAPLEWNLKSSLCGTELGERWKTKETDRNRGRKQIESDELCCIHGTGLCNKCISYIKPPQVKKKSMSYPGIE